MRWVRLPFPPISILTPLGSGVTMIPVEKLEADPELRHLLSLKSVSAYPLLSL